MKKRTAITFMICLFFLMIPLIVYAESNESGLCGESISWTLDDQGVLTISGSGEMADYSYGEAPWYDIRLSIKSVVIDDTITGIGEYAFLGCSNLTNINIPSSVTDLGNCAFEGCGFVDLIIPDTVVNIGNWAFARCADLGSIKLPDGLISLGSCLFNYCSNLKDINIPDSVNSIGEWAFGNCSSLTYITVPNLVTKIENNAFAGCTNLGTIVLPDNLYIVSSDSFPSTVQIVCHADSQTAEILSNLDMKLVSPTAPDYQWIRSTYGTDNASVVYTTSYTGDDVNVVIPSTIDGLPVIAVHNNTFKNNLIVKSITIPDSAKWIGGNAFYGCSNLESIILGANVVDIWEYAFYGCSSLKTIVFPSSVNRLAEYVFAGCNSLKTIYVPDTVTILHDNAFYNCAGVEEIRLPSYLTQLPERMFNGCTNLKRVIYPENLTKLPQNSVPSGVIPVVHANSNTAKLFTNMGQSIKVQSPDSPDFLWYRTSDGMLYITGYAGESAEVAVPASIDELPVICIANNAFRYNEEIVKVTLPESIQWIGGFGFFDCKNLKEIIIPGNVDSVWEYAFCGCTSLEKLTLCNGITRVSDYAFCNCISLREVIIPESLTILQSSAFSNGCNNLIIYCGGKEEFFNYFIGRSGVIAVLEGSTDDGLIWEVTTEGLLTISGTGNMCDYSIRHESNGNQKTDAPWGRFEINQVVIEEGVTSIGSNAFFRCDRIQNVSFPSTLTEIRNHAFYYCVSLNSLVFPDCLQIIGNASFYGCTCITNQIFIPDSVTYVGSSFQNWAVAYATLGSDGAKALSKAGYRFIDPGRGGGVYRYFYNYSDQQITGLELYSCNSTAELFEVPDGVTSIRNNAFSSCINLESVLLPDSIISIGDSAFDKCQKLDSIIIPDGLTSLGKTVFNSNTKVYATIGSEGAKTISKSGIGFFGVGTSCKFRYCFTEGVESGLELIGCDTAATSVTIPYGVTDVSKNAFNNCIALAEVVIPNGVKTLGSYAFYRCSSLTDIDIPDSVGSIGDYAFSNCAKLSVVLIPDSVISVGSHAFDGNCRIKTNKCSNIAYLWAVENNNPCETTKHEGITIDAFIAPTCTETGLTEGKHCSVCGTVFVPQELIVANGHHIVTDIEAKAPGCVIAGHTAASHCDVCNEILESSTEIPPTGHQPVTDHYIPATYSSTGLTEGSHCGACGIILKDQKIIPVKSGLQSETEFEDGNGFIYSLSCSTTYQNYILYHDLVNRKNLTLTYAIFAQYADGSTDLALIQKTAGNVDDSSNYGDIVDGSLRVFQHDMYSNEDGTVATFGFILSKPATVYATLTGGGLSKRTQDVPIYTTYINYYGAWALKYSQSGSSVIDVSNDGKYKDYRIYLEQDGRAFYVDDEGPLEVEWQVNDNALNIFGLSFIPLDNGDVAMPLGSTLRNIYRKVDDGLTVSGLQGRLGTWKAYMAVKEPEGVQVPISMLNDSVAKRVYLHADNTVYIPYGDGGPIQCGKVSVNNSDIYIDGVKSDFSFNQYGQLIRHLSDDITLLYMPVGDASSIPDIVKYAGPWYAESIIEMGYQRIADIAGLEDFLSLDAVIYLDGRIVIHYCGKEENGTWTVKNGYFETQGLSRAISFSALGELLFDLGNENYLCCGRNEPSGTGRKLSLPSSLTKIEEEAFYGTNEKIIVVPKRCRTIGARAFGNCPNLTYVYMPDSVASISNDAFINSPCVVLICESDNAAAQFARQRNINYFIH